MISLITTTSALADACAKLANDTYIAIDTEFKRESTYYSQLCVVQCAGRNHAFAIDMLVNDLDISPLQNLLRNPNIVKILHSSRQDLEIFWQLWQILPEPFADTQLMAMALGLGDSVAYSALVQHYLALTLDKSQQYTDWSKRPLSARQLTYALDDVHHLYNIYPTMQAELVSRARTAWIDEEMASLRSKVTTPFIYEDAWRRVTIPERFPRKHFGMLKLLGDWRERLAQSYNVPRLHLLSDAILLGLASLRPRELSSLQPHLAKTLLAKDQNAQQALLTLLQQSPPTPVMLPRSRALNDGEKARFQQLRALLQEVAEREQIVPRLIASKQMLYDLILIHDPEQRKALPVFQGWRYEVFGKLVA
jgi:ribonuclease D